MNDLNFVLDVLVNAREKLKDNGLLDDFLKTNIGESFEVVKQTIEYNQKIELAVRKVCKDGEIMALGESGNYTKVNIDNLNEVIRLLNK